MSSGERASWTTTLIGAALVAAPFVSDSYASVLQQGAYALMFIGAIAALSGFCLVFFFRSRDRYRRRLLAGEGVLANWSYSASEWKDFSGSEVVRQSSGLRWLLGITAGFMVAATLWKMKEDREAGLFVGAVMLVTWIICWIVVRTVVKKYRRRAAGPALEVRIGRDAMLVGDELHVWRGWGNLLHGCSVVEGPPRQLKIVYSIQGRTNRPIVDVQVPVPAGRETEADGLVRQLSGEG
jgi:uncharacterized membrane protein HdeD (DUF308 family)